MADMKDVKQKLIVISGGGTGGPSMVPLALAQAYYKFNSNTRFVFFGNDEALEQKLFSNNFKALNADYYVLPSGKWRRYFSWYNFSDLIKIIKAFFKAFNHLKSLKPDLIISAGSFASVPLVWAGKLLKIKILVHQQDILPGLANRLMAPWADKISVCFESSLSDYGRKAVLIGNPSEAAAITEDVKSQVRLKFKLKLDKPLLFITGGASGSLAINKLIFAALPYLSSDWQIVHQSGRGKDENAPVQNNYQIYPSIAQQDFLALMACADIIVSRAGLGALTAISALAKPGIIIAMPNSHQENNADYFQSKEAAVVLAQADLNGEKLAKEIESLYQDKNRSMRLAYNISLILPKEAAVKGAKIIQKMLADK
jgi:UDP-N-acetylglucosamine--N-acetylmuramyl-(pentapeptide) pyrophosphoryl-undecaprenol N-acetylglucosamine transferase